MIKSIITPMPPVQWVRQRHINMLGGKSLKDLAVVTPVVVNPETLSKTAANGSAGLNKKYGMEPNKHTKSQPQPTTAMASLTRNL